MKLAQLALLMSWTALAQPGFGQQTFEVIALKHSTVEQVLPALRPLLERGGTLSGHSGQLFVRASPRNVEELRRALDAIDRPRRRLQVSVRFDDADQSARQSVEAGGRISNRGSEVEVRARDARSAGQGHLEQRVQVLEGGRALILLGESRPVRARERIQTPAGVITQEGYVMRETASGFEAIPRLVGARVQLDIAPQREHFAGSQGAVDSRRLVTTATAALGEWFEIGGAVSEALRASGGLAASGSEQASASRRIWARVDEVP